MQSDLLLGNVCVWQCSYYISHVQWRYPSAQPQKYIFITLSLLLYVYVSYWSRKCNKREVTEEIRGGRKGDWV